jgi:hypothetical protein
VACLKRFFCESPNRHHFDVIEDIRDKKGGLFEVFVNGDGG